MTAQASEKLIHQGKGLLMHSLPLNRCRSFNIKARELLISSTGLWRGYLGDWTIIDGRLYLIGIHGTLKNGEKVSLYYFFPGYPNIVFAHWSSGSLEVMFGKCIEYIHMGFASRYEKEWHIFVENGVVVGEKTILNSPVQRP
ncbi:hypothetical protein H8K35_08280 [Undibacterium sp. LX40W]|uniref:Uncharacterized protein n=1 Tax=Undibacterium nitidum TaxID=2762298 RepID=A0A923HLG9_9BURK|nr:MULTISPECIES: hypothetical protein [Undibacterium]MBC3881569.1 hypothetical protein [Undibacterium nitidum]MBC3891649.1 hypothetical protein [Undibacterium sp. LX40W]